MARRVAVVENRSCTSSITPSRAAGNTPGKGAAARTGSVPDRSSVVTPTKNGGIRHPPPDVRCIVDKTAEFVAQNGVEFEMKILSNEKRNPRFNFLKSKDTYHPYYQQRILEFLDQGQSPVKTAKPNACEGNSVDQHLKLVPINHQEFNLEGQETRSETLCRASSIGRQSNIPV